MSSPSCEHKLVYRNLGSVAQTKRQGLSLIELMIALLLSGLLLTMLMGLTGRISQSNNRVIDNDKANPWQLQLKRQLQTDFENCRFVAQDGAGIRFSGYSEPVALNLTAVNEPAMGHVRSAIRYSVSRQKDGSPQLRREELIIDLPPPDNRFTSLAAIGVTGIQILQRINTNVAPPILKLQLTFDDGRAPLKFTLVRFGGDANDQ